MSGFDAIGAVSSTLKSLLVAKVDSPPGVAPALTVIPVSVGIPPGDDDDDTAKARLNLFLYRVTENGHLANQEIPGHGANGAAYGHPPLSLDLHYLLTAYGSSQSGSSPPLLDERLAHYMLGSAMRVLHDFPIITAELESTTGAQILEPSLENAYERVKVTLEPLSLEDVAKVWTALSRPYRLSAAYSVSVVQIETNLATRHPRPVGAPPPAGPRVVAVAAGSPRIHEVHAATRPGPYARIGDTLVLTGTDLAGEPTLARIGTVDATGAVTSARFDRVTLVVPDDPRLQPGILPLRIAHGLLLGEPPRPHGGMKSNTAAFVLIPTVTGATITAAGKLRVQGRKLLAPDVECETIVGAESVLSYAAASTESLLIMDPPAGAASGAPIRVRVNGAESLDPVAIA